MTPSPAMPLYPQYPRKELADVPGLAGAGVRQSRARLGRPAASIVANLPGLLVLGGRLVGTGPNGAGLEIRCERTRRAVVVAGAAGNREKPVAAEDRVALRI